MVRFRLNSSAFSSSVNQYHPTHSHIPVSIYCKMSWCCILSCMRKSRRVWPKAERMSVIYVNSFWTSLGCIVVPTSSLFDLHEYITIVKTVEECEKSTRYHSHFKKERPYLSCLVQLYEEVLYVITKFWALKVTDFIFQVDELKSRNFQNFYFSLCRNCFAFSLFTVFCWWRCPGWLSRSGYANTLDNIFFAKSILYISVCVQWAILSFNVLLSIKAPGFLNQFAVQSLHMTIFRGIYVFVCLLKHLINDP